MNPFTYIKAAHFFPAYAPQVSNWTAKMRGKNTRGAPLDFSPADMQAIREGLYQLFTDLAAETARSQTKTS